MALNKLTKARIYRTDKAGAAKLGDEVICWFNPNEYTISKTNTYEEKSSNGSDVPIVFLKKPGPQELKLKLIFDGYEGGKDVGKQLYDMWNLMHPRKSPEHTRHPDHKVPAPYVKFEWGPFKFVSVIKTMTQKFTLFKPNGTPVRAEVTVSLTQYLDKYDYAPQNPTSGGGVIEQVWRVKEGDRLDIIAAQAYGDATKWPEIAAYNDIVNPHRLRSGMLLNLPAVN